jgi:hypothetical protein
MNRLINQVENENALSGFIYENPHMKISIRSDSSKRPKQVDGSRFSILDFIKTVQAEVKTECTLFPQKKFALTFRKDFDNNLEVTVNPLTGTA